jgi:hypothetical protein
MHQQSKHWTMFQEDGGSTSALRGFTLATGGRSEWRRPCRRRQLLLSEATAKERQGGRGILFDQERMEEREREGLELAACSADPLGAVRGRPVGGQKAGPFKKVRTRKSSSSQKEIGPGLCRHIHTHNDSPEGGRMRETADKNWEEATKRFENGFYSREIKYHVARFEPISFLASNSVL